MPRPKRPSVPASLMVEDLIRQSEPEPNSGCWIWTGPWSPHTGYGMTHWIVDGVRRAGTAHRAAWELTHQRLMQKGLHTDHLCRVTLCINPMHLEAVTSRENSLRGPLGRHWLRVVCRRGHPLDTANTYVWIESDGRKHRQCRRCHADRELQRHRRNRDGRTQPE